MSARQSGWSDRGRGRSTPCISANDRRLRKVFLAFFTIFRWRSQAFLTVGFVFFSGVSGTGMTKISFAIETIVIALYILITYLLVNLENSRVEWVWCVEIIYGLIIGLLSYLYLKFGNWKYKRI